MDNQNKFKVPTKKARQQGEMHENTEIRIKDKCEKK